MDTRKQRHPAVESARALADHKGFSLISNQKLLALYSGLRRLGKPGRSRLPEAQSPFTSREAGAIAASIDLREGDWLGLLRRGAVLTIEPSLDGIVRFASRPKPKDPAAKASAARNRANSAQESNGAVERILGASLVLKTENKGGICVVLTHERPDKNWDGALKIAAAHSLPLILVRQPDKGAPRAASPVGTDATRRRRSEAAGSTDEPYLPFIPVDSNDVVAIYRVVYEAIGRARKGRGPTVIDCLPYQVEAAGARRSKAAGDSVASMEHYLAGKGLLSSKARTNLRGGVFRKNRSQ